MADHEEVKCPFCERSFDAYLMYRHMAVAHCDKIEDFIKLLKQLPGAQS